MRGLSAGFRGSQSSATIAGFPNVAVYLDEQSMQFPARNVDIYMVDLDRIEVLEGPQGTLFGGGAEAGAVRYITNKPNLEPAELHAEAGYGLTDGGGPNANVNAMVNMPIVAGQTGRARGGLRRPAGRLHRQRAQHLHPLEPGPRQHLLQHPSQSAGSARTVCRRRTAGLCALPNSGTFNNFALAGQQHQPGRPTRARASRRCTRSTPTGTSLITESVQDLDARGHVGGIPRRLELPAARRAAGHAVRARLRQGQLGEHRLDLNGKIGDLRLIYTGGYTERHIKEQMDYTNYSRTVGGMYYECTGGSTGWGPAANPKCFSPAGPAGTTRSGTPTSATKSGCQHARTTGASAPSSARSTSSSASTT